MKRLGQIVVVAAILFFVIRALVQGFSEIRSYDFDFRGLPLVLSALVALASFTLPSCAWLALVRGQGIRSMGLLDAFRIWFYSFMGRYIPGKVALVALRVKLSKPFGLSLTLVASVAVVEVAAAIAASTLLSFPMLASHKGLSPWPVLLLLGAALLAILTVKNERLFRTLNKWLAPKKELVALNLTSGQLLTTMAFYCGHWVLTSVALNLFLVSFIPVKIEDFPLIASAYILAYVGGMAAVFAPSGIGVRELAFATLLQSAFDKDVAYAVAVAARIWSTLVEVFVLLVIVGLRRVALFRAERKARQGG